VPDCYRLVMVVPPMQSISGNVNGTYESYMVGLSCRPYLRPRQLILGDYSFVVASLEFICCHTCIPSYAPPFLMWSLALDLSGSCPREAKSHFTDSKSWRSTPNYYPPSNYKFIVWCGWIHRWFRLELFGWYFPGIYTINTKGSLSWYIFPIWQEPPLP